MVKNFFFLETEKTSIGETLHHHKSQLIFFVITKKSGFKELDDIHENAAFFPDEKRLASSFINTSFTGMQEESIKFGS